MKYMILLWPHANARYRAETVRLARAELEVILSRADAEARVETAGSADLPMLSIETGAPLEG